MSSFFGLSAYSYRLSRLPVPLVVVLLAARLFSLGATSYPSRFANDTRPRRDLAVKYLIFPQGSNVQLVYCMTIGTYSRPQGIFTIGLTAGLAYELPHAESKLYRDPPEVYHRRSRRELYRQIELMLKSQGKDGRTCVLKALCEAGNRDPGLVGTGTFLQEILHSIFTLPGGFYEVDPMTPYEKAYSTKENCQEAYVNCPDVFQQFPS